MDKDIICHIAAQRAGVSYHGSSKYPRIGRLAIFQPVATPSSFGVDVDRMESNRIADRVRVMSFLMTFAWYQNEFASGAIGESLVDINMIGWCENCGAYHSKGDNCPNECPEQKYCACGNHHDGDQNDDGYTDESGEWFCDDCKDDCEEYLRMQAQNFADVQYEAMKDARMGL